MINQLRQGFLTRGQMKLKKNLLTHYSGYFTWSQDYSARYNSSPLVFYRITFFYLAGVNGIAIEF